MGGALKVEDPTPCGAGHGYPGGTMRSSSMSKCGRVQGAESPISGGDFPVSAGRPISGRADTPDALGGPPLGSLPSSDLIRLTFTALNHQLLQMSPSSRLSAVAAHLAPISPAPVPTGRSLLFEQSPDDVVICSAVRTAFTRGKNGAFKDTCPEDLLVAVLTAVAERAGCDKSVVEEIQVGNCLPPGAFEFFFSELSIP